MADMREPYAHIKQEIIAYECTAKSAREEISRLTAVAEAYEESARSLAYALNEQKNADADREQDA